MVRRQGFAIVSVVCLCAASMAGADVIHVSAGQSIQTAINSAFDGDVIVLAPGTYFEDNIHFFGKAITVQSSDPSDRSVVASTIVDGNADSDAFTTPAGSGPLFVFRFGEGRCTLLDGLTLRRGEGQPIPVFGSAGGGIYCQNSSPTIRRCIIEDNVNGQGAGAYFDGGAALLERCHLRRNEVFQSGGAIKIVNDSVVEIRNNLITGNASVHPNAGGAGIDCFQCDDSWPIIRNNVFAGNEVATTTKGCAISCSDSRPDVHSNVFFENRNGEATVWWDCNEAAFVCFNDFAGNTAPLDYAPDDACPGNVSPAPCSGNYFVVPNFEDPGAWNGAVWEEPAAPSYYIFDPGGDFGGKGDPSVGWDGAERDYDGFQRISGLLDVGAYELAAQPVVVSQLYVNATAAECAVGESWDTAYHDLQLALSRLQAERDLGDHSIQEIWIAGGTYRPSRPTDESLSRTVTFNLPPDITLIGGFSGTESLASDANMFANETALSGNIGSVAIGDNAFHVVTAVDTGVDIQDIVTLENLFIREGWANGPCLDGHNVGAGVKVTNARILLRNCEVTSNWTLAAPGGCNPSVGAGVYLENSILHLDSTQITFNSSGDGGGGIYVGPGSEVSGPPGPLTGAHTAEFNLNIASGQGGAVLSEGGVVSLNAVSFANNDAANGGGAVAATSGSWVSIGAASSFSANRATGELSFGGAMYVSDSSATCDSVVFAGNESNGQGGAVYGFESDIIDPAQTVMSFINCEFTLNKGSKTQLQYFAGGGIHTASGTQTTIVDSRFSNNSPPTFPGDVAGVFSEGDLFAAGTIGPVSGGPADPLICVGTFSPGTAINERGSVTLICPLRHVERVRDDDQGFAKGVTEIDVASCSDHDSIYYAHSFDPGNKLLFDVLDSPAVGACGPIPFATYDAYVRPYVLAETPIFNGDQLLVLDYSTNSGAGAMTAILTNLDGLLSFASTASTNLSFVPTDLAAGKLYSDIDSDDDIAVTTSAGTAVPGWLFVLKNGGHADGNWLGFVSVGQYAVGADPRGLSIGELDGSNGNDIAVANAADDSISLFYNDGADEFTTDSIALSAGDEPVDVAIADVHSSAGTELAIALAGPEEIALRSTSGTSLGGLGLGGRPTKVDPGDADNDKDVDLFVLSDASGKTSVSIVENVDGDDSLLESEPQIVGDFAGDESRFESALADLNNDGFVDLITTDPEGDAIAVLLNDGTGSLLPSASLPVGGAPWSLTAADLDGDSDADIALVRDTGDPQRRVTILESLLDGGQQLAFAESNDLVVAGSSSPRRIVAADINSDALEDLVVTNDESPLAGSPTSAAAVLLNTFGLCAGDVQGVSPGVVDVGDLLAILGAWGSCDLPCPPTCAEDVADANCVVDVSDLLLILANWGPCQ